MCTVGSRQTIAEQAIVGEQATVGEQAYYQVAGVLWGAGILLGACLTSTIAGNQGFHCSVTSLFPVGTQRAASSLLIGKLKNRLTD